MQSPHQNVRRIAVLAATLFLSSAVAQNTSVYLHPQATFRC